MTVARPPHASVVSAAQPSVPAPSSPLPSPPSSSRPSLLRRPPLWLAVAVCVAAIVAMTFLRLVVFPYRVMPIAYGMPLILFVWLRNRALLWFTVAAFTVITAVKFLWLLPNEGPESLSDPLRFFDFALVQIDLFAIGAVVHMLIVARDWLEARNAELRLTNGQLEALNRALAEREEDVARQNEELQSQTEELERQTEELRGTNEELTRREHVTEALLSLSRGLSTELTRDEMMSRVCEVLKQLLDGDGLGVAILEQDGGVMRVGCHQGFGRDGPVEPTLPMDRSFASLVLSRGRTAYIEDLSARPDLAIPRRADGMAPFSAVLAAPLRTSGWPMGTLEVYRTTPGPWGDDDVAVVESLAAQISISLEALAHLQNVSQERRRFETVLRAVPVGIAVCTADPTELRLNPAGAAMFNTPTDVNVVPGSEQQPTSVTYHEGRVIAPDQWPLFVAAREGVDVHGMELDVVMSGGRRVSILTTAAPIRDAEGKPNGAVAAFVDITPLKELQRELDARRRDAEEASVRKTRFLAAVSHDIRTPANAISLLAELIRRTASNPALAGEVPELAKELHGSAMSLVELLGDVLDLARYDSGRLEIQETDFSLGELLDEEYRRFVPLAREKGLALHLSAPEKPVRLRTDRIKLSRVIGNLVGNAIKFTTTGEIRLEGARGGGDGGGGDATPVIRVIDTGIGIAAEHQQHIFDEFVQLHNRERDRNKGTGLGLTICKRLVDAMGGTLSVVSEPGQGTTFTVTLPPASVVP